MSTADPNPDAIAIAEAEKAEAFYVELARHSYDAYTREISRRWSPSCLCNGTPLTWEEIPESNRVAWIATVKETIVRFCAHIPDDAGCYARAVAKGEPTFTLRGQDPTAAATIFFWISQNPAAPFEKLQTALAKARRMSEWRPQKATD